MLRAALAASFFLPLASAVAVAQTPTADGNGSFDVTPGNVDLSTGQPEKIVVWLNATIQCALGTPPSNPVAHVDRSSYNEDDVTVWRVQPPDLHPSLRQTGPTAYAVSDHYEVFATRPAPPRENISQVVNWRLDGNRSGPSASCAPDGWRWVTSRPGSLRITVYGDPDWWTRHDATAQGPVGQDLPQPSPDPAGLGPVAVHGTSTTPPEAFMSLGAIVVAFAVLVWQARR